MNRLPCLVSLIVAVFWIETAVQLTTLKGDFGLTAKFGITPTITLDLAYNPDLAQVEADAPVSTANQRFPIFFPEKRPFFSRTGRPTDAAVDDKVPADRCIPDADGYY